MAMTAAAALALVAGVVGACRAVWRSETEEVQDSVRLRSDAQLSWKQTKKTLRHLKRKELKTRHCNLRRRLTQRLGITEAPSHVSSYYQDFRTAGSLVAGLHASQAPDVPFDSVTVFGDGRNLRGGMRTALPARLAEVALNAFGKLGTFAFSIIDPALPVTTSMSGLPFFHSLGKDDAVGLAQFMCDHLQRMTALVAFLSTLYAFVWFVLDGATFQGALGFSSKQCPACGIAAPQLRHFDAPGTEYPGIVDWILGVPFLRFSSIPAFVFAPLRLPNMRYIWGWGHLAAHSITKFLTVALDFADRAVPGTSPLITSAIQRAVPAYRARAKLTFGEAKKIADALWKGQIPTTGTGVIDQFLMLFAIMMTLLRSPPEDYDGWTVFDVVVKRMKIIHYAYADALLRDIAPSIHYLYEHFGVIWRTVGRRMWPKWVGEEAGEKLHQEAQSAWIQSMMTVVNPRTGETGATQILVRPGLEVLLRVV